MKISRLWPSVSAVVLLFLLVFVSGFAAAQGSKMASPIEDAAQDNPRARDSWFMKGRTAPAGHSAAALRYRAHQQKLQLRALRPQKFAAGLMSSSPTATWSSVGPAPMVSDAGTGQDYGVVTGRVNAVAIDPADPTGNTVYIGGAYGGLWRSTNATSGTVTWTPLTDDQPTLSFGAIAIQPGNATGNLSNVIVVGTGETNGAIDSYYGLGFLRSVDGGQNWTLISTANGGLSLKGLGVARMAFSTAPGQTNVVIAAVGTAPVGSEDGAATNGSMRGIYTSLDTGATWSREKPTDAGVVIEANSATSVAYNAGAAKFFAAIRNHGIYSSPDGVNWTRLANQPAPAGIGLNGGSTVCPANPSSLGCPIYRGEIAVVHDANPVRNEMYVWYVDNNIADQGIWRTLDGGNTWTEISETGFTICGDPSGCGAQQAFFNMSLAAVPNGPSATDLYLGAVNEFKCTLLSGGTTCNGGSWLNLTHVYGCPDIAHVHPDEHAVDFKIVGGKDLMYFGNDGGVYRALDGFTGLTSGSCGGTNQFGDLNARLGSLSQFVSFSQDPTNPVVLLGGTQDNGSPATNQVGTSLTWINVNAGDGGYNEINPASTNEWFTANTDVTIQRCTSGIACTTNTFVQVVSNATLGTDVGSFYTPYILDPQSNVSELLVGTCRVWRGPGAGGSFTVLSNNFDTGTTAACTGSEINLVHAIAAGGPKNNISGFSNVVYATTDGTGPLGGLAGGHVFVTTNAGTSSMTNVTNNLGNLNAYTVSGVAIDTSDLTGQTAYVTIMGFGGPHVSKTTNAGGSWTDFTANLPDAPANTILVDPGTNPNTGTIYVGTDIGVFSSPTSAANWTEVGPAPSSGQAGFLPNVPVTKLRIFTSATQKLLRASTYGRGIWQASLVLTPDFNVTITNSPQTIFPTQTVIFNGKLSAVNGYNSPVNLSCTAATTAPPGNCTPAPSNLTPTVSGAPFTVTTGGVAGDYIFNAHAVGTDTNTTAHDGSITLHIIDFALTAPNPATVSANRPNASNATTFQVTAAGSFNQPVTLACSGLPTGANCNFSPSASVSPTSGNPVTVTLTIGTSNSTPTGTSSITLSATTANAPGPKTRTLTLTVTALPDYTLAISNPSLSTPVNQFATFNGTLKAMNGYSGSVTLTCGTGAPANCTFNPASPITPTPGGIPFTVTVGSATARIYSFNINGNGPGALTSSQSVPVTFTATTDFTLGSNPANESVLAGQTAAYTLTFAPSGATTFSIPVTYTCAVTPVVLAGPTCSLNPASPINPGTGTTTVTMTVRTLGPNAIAPAGRGSSRAALALFGTGLLLLGFRYKSGMGRARDLMVLIILLIPVFSLLSCGGGSSSGGGGLPPSPPPSPISVAINPTSANLFTTSPPTQFTATVSNTSNTQVNWAVAGVTGGNTAVGTISTSGMYTPPSAVPASNPVTVSAVSQADTTKSASAAVTIATPTPSQTYTITVNAVSGAVVHQTVTTLVVQ